MNRTNRENCYARRVNRPGDRFYAAPDGVYPVWLNCSVRADRAEARAAALEIAYSRKPSGAAPHGDAARTAAKKPLQDWRIPFPMTAESVKVSAPPKTVPVSAVEGRELARLIRESFAVTEPKADEVAQYFYGALFVVAPDCRDLFPVTMASQRSRLLRALVYVVQMVDRPDELTTFLGQLGRDHRKFAVVARHYDAVGIALLSAMKRFLKQKWTPEVESAWTTAYGRIAKTMREAAQAETGPASWAARVLDHRKLSRDVAMVRVQTEGLLPFRAGSYVSVEVPQRPRMWRYLSPAPAPRGDGQMTFHVRAVPGGWVSGAIVNHTKLGDVWRLGPAMGALDVRPTATRKRLLMIAGGTGVTPFVSLLDDLAHWRRTPPVHLND